MTHFVMPLRTILLFAALSGTVPPLFSQPADSAWFPFSPARHLAAIGLVDDWHKPLVTETGSLAYDFGPGPYAFPVVEEALAPGVDPKSLELSVVQGSLTIKGEKPGLAQVSAEAYHRNERAAGRFLRTIELPAEVEADKVRADYRNGLLLITLPKVEAARPRQIPLTVG